MKKLISWNVNGLRACVGKGFMDFFNEVDADVFCIQESKLQEGQIDLDLPGYHQYWNYAEKKGYSGTAMFTKEEPISVSYGLGIEEHDHEGRVITAEFPEYYIVTCYTPNSKDGLARLDYRMTWEDAFLAYLKKLEEKKPVIFCGDLVNIRYTELDSTAMRLLGGIRSRYGTFSITGNHDTGNYVRDTLSLPPATNIAALVERQRAMGWRVLDNETVYLRRGDDSIALSGISYDRSLARQRHDRTLPGYDFGTTYRDVPQELYNITAAHIPQLWEQILDAGYGDLTLSGHVHSMQCKIRLFGRAFSPAQLMYRHWSGPYEKQGRTLYVNDGIGYVGFPMRIGANPEITLFELRR